MRSTALRDSDRSAVIDQLISAGYRLDEEFGVWLRSRPERTTAGSSFDDEILAVLHASEDVSTLSPELAGCTAPQRSVLASGADNSARALEPILGDFVLELGSRYGETTRYLGETRELVVAVEPVLSRAAVCRERCRDLEHVIVVSDPLWDFTLSFRFDCVLMLGVAEFLPNNGSHPFSDLLQRANAWRRPAGVIAVGISNRLGLRSWTGTSHNASDTIAYSHTELTKLLDNAGLGSQATLVPFPDDRAPSTVLYPRARVEGGELVSSLIRFSRCSADVRPPGIATESMWPSIVQERALLFAANAFLIVAGPVGNGRVRKLEKEKTLAVHFGGLRAPRFRKDSRFEVSDRGVTVVRASRFRNDLEPVSFQSSFPRREKLIAGRPWTAELAAIVSRTGWRCEELVAWAAFWFSKLRSVVGQGAEGSQDLLPPTFFDAGPQNLVVDEGGVSTFIDLEWSPESAITVGLVVFRSLLWSLSSLTWSAAPHADVPKRLGLAIRRIFEGLRLAWPEDDAAGWLQLESAFQTVASGALVRLEPTILESYWAGLGTFVEPGSMLSAIDVRVYFSKRGNELAEADSIARAIQLTAAPQTVVIVLPETQIRSVRIDLGTQPGFYVLDSVRVFSKQRDYFDVRAASSSDLILVPSDDSFVVLNHGHDPFWHVELDEIDERLRIEVVIRRADNDRVAKAVAAMTNRALRFTGYAGVIDTLARSSFENAALADCVREIADGAGDDVLTDRVARVADNLRHVNHQQGVLHQTKREVERLEREMTTLQARLARIESHPIVKLARRGKRALAWASGFTKKH